MGWLRSIGVSLGIIAAGCASESAPPKDPGEAFWAWFAEHGAEIPERPSNPLPRVVKELSSRLHRVHAGFAWELSSGGTPRELTISADGNSDLFDEVRRFVASAPPIPGWKVVALRQPTPGAGAMTYNGATVDPNVDRYAAQASAGLVHLTFYLRDLASHGDDAKGAAILSLDSLLGELIVETKTGGMQFKPLSEAPAGAKLLRDLPKEPIYREELEAGRTS